MTHERFQQLVIVVTLVAAVSCSPDQPARSTEAVAPPAPAQAPREPEESQLHPVALGLLDRLDEGGHTIESIGDLITSPASFASLVELGTEALPTVLYAAETTHDDWTRDLLIEVAGRIGDRAARPVLERFLQAERPNTVSEAIGALGRLGGARSIPALRELLSGDASSTNSFERLQILEAIYQCGDQSVFADVLTIGLTDREQQFSAAKILTRHQPLRDALGFEGPWRAGGLHVEERLFFRAAEEWYREEVLGEPSPWRAPQADFSQPYAAEKHQAWSILLRACEDGNSSYSNLRATAVDPVVTAADASRALTVISGWGHGHGLVVVAWRPRANGQVRGHRFEFRLGSPRSAFPEDHGEVTYETATLATYDYTALVAGLRAILEAKLVRWWSGPRTGFMGSSGNFVVSLRGLGKTHASSARFCGYPGSENRTRYLAPSAALRWMWEFLADRARFEQAEPGDAARQVFADTFRVEQPEWAGPRSGWWWVRERMVSLAGAFGDDTLLEPLATYLSPGFAEAEYSDPRPTAKACSALAAITGVEFRFAADGSPRELRDVARAYLALLERN